MLDIKVEGNRLEARAAIDLLTVTYGMYLGDPRSDVLHCWIRGPYQEWKTEIDFYNYFHEKELREGNIHGVIVVEGRGIEDHARISDPANLQYSIHGMIIPCYSEEHARELITADLQELYRIRKSKGGVRR